MHLLGDPLIELEAGADAARLDAYAVVFQTGAGRRREHRPHARDALPSTTWCAANGTWCIHHRVAAMEWMRC